MKDDTKWFLEEVLLRDFEDFMLEKNGAWDIPAKSNDTKGTIEDVKKFLKEKAETSYVKFDPTDEKLVKNLYKAYSKKYEDERR